MDENKNYLETDAKTPQEIEAKKVEEPARRKNYFMRNPFGTFGILGILLSVLCFFLIPTETRGYDGTTYLFFAGVGLFIVGVVLCFIGLSRKPRLLSVLGVLVFVLFLAVIVLGIHQCSHPSRVVMEPDEIVNDTVWEYNDSLGKYVPIVEVTDEEVVEEDTVAVAEQPE
ncbi:MAG: hypothetical protein J6X81_01595 [Muribaculaceae bacterium]|nr:hypothetical protein [Muribaculaceae bacterium]